MPVNNRLTIHTLYLLALWLSALIVGFAFSLLLYQNALASPAAATATVIYVDGSAAGPTHDGTSWGNAYITLQDALAAATAGEEIWVAAGIYYPDEGSGATADVVSATFTLKTGVAIYGGFDGTETERTERNWLTNLTILSGDLTQNDPDINSNGVITDPATIAAPNAYHVVSADSADGSTILDGFTITGGHADGDFTNGCGDACGGGLLLDNNSAVQLNNLAIQGNFADFYGAGITAIDSTPSLQNVTIQGNRANNSGGGMYNLRSNSILTNVAFSGNRASSRGGALYNYRVPTVVILTNVTISGNRAQHSGGGIRNVESAAALQNSILWNNSANNEQQISNGTDGSAVVTQSLVENAFSGGSWDSTLGTDGGNNLDSDPLFTTAINPTDAPTLAGDLRLTTYSPAADAGNSAANLTTTDVDNQNRFQGASIDMGAYESALVAQLNVTKAVTPTVIEYGEPVTYTIVLSNTGSAFAYNTLLTDTLPTDTDFASWQQQPISATYNTGSDAITWMGTVTPTESITYEFVVTHTGGPDETITNTVTYDHGSGNGTTDVSFTVLPLPIVNIADVTTDESKSIVSFKVSLETTSRKAVTVQYDTSDNSAEAGLDYQADSDTATIAAGDTERLIHVLLFKDFIDEETEEFTMTLSSPVDGTLGDATATASILDDDTAGTNVAPTALAITEPSDSASFTITFDSQPVAPVQVSLSNSDTSECSVPANVTIDETNWQEGVGVAVLAVDDFIVDGAQTCTLGFTATSTDTLYQDISFPSVEVTVSSDDVAGIGIDPIGLTIGEAGEVDLYTITLTSEPTATVNIDLTSTDSSECSVTPSISLNAGNWNSGVPVTVTAVDDDIDDDNQSCTITSAVTSADPNYDGRAMSTVPVTVVDDDTVGVLVSSTAITTAEPAGQTSFNVALNSEPTDPVTIDLTSLQTDECSVPTNVILNSSNWEAGLPVTVSAVDDRIDDANQFCTVQTDVTSDDAKYDGLAAADVTVTVRDDNDEAGVLLSTETLTVSEPNTTDSFLVTLSSEPVAPVTIDLTSQDSTECTVTSSITLNASNWQTGRNVTVTAIDDNHIDGTQSCTITTTATSIDDNYLDIAVADPVVNVEDNDVANVLLDTPTVIVSEPDNNTLMVLKLTSIPTDTVNIALTSTDSTECSVVANVLLDETNWNSGIAAPVFAVNDDVDDGDQTCNISATITSNDTHYNGLAVSDFPTSVLDDDTAGTTISPANLTITEPAATGRFTVALTSEPTGTVTVTLASADTGECIVPTSTTLSPANWQQGVAVTVTAVDDQIDDEAQLCTIETATTSDDPLYEAIAIADLPVTVNDDDVAGVVVAPQTLTIGEPDRSDSFTIRLTSEPTQTVTVNLSSNDLGECTVPANISLDASTWAAGITVTVQAVNDQIDDADQLCTVATDVTSQDGDYAGITANDVAVTVQDDADTAGIIVATTTLTVSEPAEVDAFTIALTSEPVEPVTITLVSSDDGECSVPAAITLDATNWQSGRAVDVNAVDDDVDDGLQQCVVQTTATSDDPLYDGMALADVTTAVEDEDVAGMHVYTAISGTLAVTVTEPDSTAVYTIALETEPTDAVIVALSVSEPTACSVPATATLDVTNWRTGVGVVVQAVDDDKIDDTQTCVISHSVSSVDPLYNGTLLPTVDAATKSEDVAGVVIAPETIILDELNGTATVTVGLTSEPATTVTVNLTSRDLSECMVTESVALDATTWRGQTVTVSAVDDALDDGDQPCLIAATVSSADTNYDQLAVTDYVVTIDDNDQITMDTAVASNVTVAEIGEIITYTYLITNTGDVTLTVQALDSNLGKVTFVPGAVAPHATTTGQLTYQVVEEDLPGPIGSMVTLTGQSPLGKAIEATRTITVGVAANPQLVVEVARLGPPVVVPQSVVTYQVTITNVGAIPARITEIQGEANTPAQAAQAQGSEGVVADMRGTAVPAQCSTPITIPAGGVHQCTILWTAVRGDSDAVDYLIRVDAEGLLDFTSTVSDSDIVIISGPTTAGSTRIYLPMVSR